MNWCPSPRMKGETAELSKLMQNKREEKTTLKASVSKIEERGGRRLKRKENAKVSAQNVVAAVQVQVATTPGDNLLKATAETAVITAAMIGLRPGQNLFREKTRGPPPKQKESQESQVLTKLKKFTKKDQELMLARFADMLDLLTFDIVKGRGEMEQEQKVKKATGKKAAEEAKAAAGPKVEMPTAAGPKEEADEPEPQIEEPDVKGVAAGSDVTAPAPEESLPQIAEPKEAEAIVAAVFELGAVDHELERVRLLEVERERQRALKISWTATWNARLGELGQLRLEIERLIEVGREKQRALKQLDGDVESIFERLGDFQSRLKLEMKRLGDFQSRLKLEMERLIEVEREKDGRSYYYYWP